MSKTNLQSDSGILLPLLAIIFVTSYFLWIKLCYGNEQYEFIKDMSFLVLSTATLVIALITYRNNRLNTSYQENQTSSKNKKRRRH